MSNPTNEQVYASNARRQERGEVLIRPAPIWIEGLGDDGTPLTDEQRSKLRKLATRAARRALKNYIRK